MRLKTIKSVSFFVTQALFSNFSVSGNSKFCLVGRGVIDLLFHLAKSKKFLIRDIPKIMSKLEAQQPPVCQRWSSGTDETDHNKFATNMMELLQQCKDHDKDTR